MLSGVPPDRVEDAGATGAVVEIAPKPTDTAVEGMNVGVLETGDQETAPEVDDPRGGADQLPDLALIADRHDPAGLDGYCLRSGTSGVDGVDAAAMEYEIG
jgi:hypothetical protein